MANRLTSESSPYLLQHAHNPVDWYPWGEEALNRAVEEQKPILVSIGYSACHWCHVMERESFENERTAAFMNRNFINIKIDREERPDLDHIYMDAVQALTGSGGWPLNVFLTPDKKPFYGGTYFPPTPMHNRPSWMDVLSSVATAFESRRTEMETQADKLTNHLLQSNQLGAGTTAHQPHIHLLHTIKDTILEQADKEEGGFGKAPKFPQTASIKYLLQYGHFYNDAAATRHALLSLDKMSAGGIYDQIGGGFSRYSVDDLWLAPHFEKMLYDNALLLMVLAEAYQKTGQDHYKTIIVQTIDFLQREMRAPQGGYYAALDADSEGVEGRYYVWDFQEFMDVLGEDGALMAAFYGVEASGNWEGTNILHTPLSDEAFATKHQLNVDLWRIKRRQASQKLLEQRTKRTPPGLDDKIILGWNGLMLSALCKAAGALKNEKYTLEAIQLGTFLEQQFLVRKEDGMVQYFHTAKNGRSHYPAFLDDLSYWARGYIHLQELTGNQIWLEKAASITAYTLQYFTDEKEMYCYYTSSLQKDILLRKKEMYDGAVPSGNAILCGNLQQLGILFSHSVWTERAAAMLAGFATTISKYPTSFGEWAGFLLASLTGYKEIVVKGVGWEKLLQEVLEAYIPVKVLQSGVNEEYLGARNHLLGISEADAEDNKNKIYPLLEGKPNNIEASIYICADYTCQAPVTSVAALLKSVAV